MSLSVLSNAVPALMTELGLLTLSNRFFCCHKRLESSGCSSDVNVFAGPLDFLSRVFLPWAGINEVSITIQDRSAKGQNRLRCCTCAVVQVIVGGTQLHPNIHVTYISLTFLQDAVTGSAHTVLAPWWASKLKRNSLTARQCSSRCVSLPDLFAWHLNAEHVDWGVNGTGTVSYDLITLGNGLVALVLGRRSLCIGGQCSCRSALMNLYNRLGPTQFSQ